MKQALILCGGKAKRLRPYSWGCPKPCMPFLNLPLLSFSWFYLEQFNVSHFLLNAHLFPEKLRSAVNFLSTARQKADIFFEAEPLGGAGTLYRLKSVLQKTEQFFYLNGDSLFFPSDKKQLSAFEEDFFSTRAEGSFFVSSLLPQNTSNEALWCDSHWNLKYVGGEKQNIPKEDLKNLWPCHFSGLALFKSSILESLNPGDFHLFSDFIKPLIAKKKLKVFVDKKAKILEAGEKQAYIESLKFCLKLLFETKVFKSQNFTAQDREIKKILETCFSRFDSEDQIIGLKNGKMWSKKLGFPLLAPNSVKGLEKLQLTGSAVLGPEVHLFGKSQLKDSVLGSQVSWKGNLIDDIILKFFP